MRFIAPQLATLSEQMPAGDGWACEVKYDGYRMQAHLDGGRARLFTRRGLDWSDRFPALIKALSALRVASAVLDGEIVAPGDGARPFQRLQQALDAGRSGDLVFYAFDLLMLDGLDLRPLPWTARRAALAKMLRRRTGPVRLGELLPGSSATILRAACRIGLEGIIAKRTDAPYVSGRGDAWLKVKCGQRQEFVIVGYTDPRGSRSGIGALLLGVYDEGALRYAGKVGTGIPAAMLDTLARRLGKLERTTSPIAGMERPAGGHWVRPSLVAEVSFTEWTEEGYLRHPSFQGLRADKNPKEIVRERPKRGRLRYEAA